MARNRKRTAYNSSMQPGLFDDFDTPAPLAGGRRAVPPVFPGNGAGILPPIPEIEEALSLIHI